MADVQFRVGDRVRIVEREPDIPVGTRGRVVRVYDNPTCDGVDVLLDDGRQLNILPGALALVPTATKPRGACSVCKGDRAPGYGSRTPWTVGIDGGS